MQFWWKLVKEIIGDMDSWCEEQGWEDHDLSLPVWSFCSFWCFDHIGVKFGYDVDRGCCQYAYFSYATSRFIFEGMYFMPKGSSGMKARIPFHSKCIKLLLNIMTSQQEAGIKVKNK